MWFIVDFFWIFFSLMQRRYSEQNMYTESLPTNNHDSDDIYDDVASTENEQEVSKTILLLDIL